MSDTPHRPTGVVIPVVDGAPSTSALGRGVVADALRTADPIGARSAESSTDWRHDYVPHFRRLVGAGLPGRAAALDIARAGLASLHTRMRYQPSGATVDLPLDAAFDAEPARPP